jgi:cation transport ATPase
MKNILLLATLTVGTWAGATEITCAVKGMHCSGCKEMIEGKVCDQAKYSTCDVSIVNADKKMGSIHLVTKDAKAKIDQKELGTIVSDTTYTLEKCVEKSPGKAEKAPAKKST